ncbi:MULTISPECIES: alpha/beta hydrolase family protein [unclassified Enterococcus]|uniref:alpha/beta hydrolase n=1 Tax=unclassified Enterococcus TaxID=2608891 RepID=UPI001557D46F|nr:esterase family protein [Enterococcus sp. MMGLQ5-2]MBS7584203.1 esterase family protein [Enterococcus sp. MMGLQ5-1]NPD12059.1 esterase family protein [Enterococcus sp. MMGLQ5-1]NPD36631.1 esterase family protein [Enterococcus sp. MMGLQ5-2]
MAIFQIEYRSDLLDMDRNMNVILPDLSELAPGETLDDIPVLYLLHGMAGNHNTWLKRTGIARLVRHTKLAIVMPSTDLAWYSNTQYGMPYFSALTEELPRIIQQFFPQISSKREKSFVAGLSMGGYGAFKFAFLTERFSYAASLSGCLSFTGMKPTDLGQEAYWNGIFGNLDLFETSENNLMIAAEKQVKQHQKQPKLYAWCGHQDFLYQANLYAVEKLNALNYDLTFESADGKHEWYYWDKQIDRVLEWLPIDYVKEERLS